VHTLLRGLGRDTLQVWYDPAYRLPIPGFEAAAGAELRRADFVAWYLADAGLVPQDKLRLPGRASYRDLARVHTPALLDSLNDPETIARVYASSAAEISPAAVVRSVRLACGATIAAAREARLCRTPMLNLAGGFHHAEPDKAGGYCLINDIAVAIAVLRADGFRGRIAIIDLDAHPPDGTAACTRHDSDVWLGSLSGTDWGPLPGGADETVISGADNRTYLHALRELLRRMPAPDLAFVVAGGDVLAGDHHGGLRLTVNGVRKRDELVAASLRGVGSVWLPAGGYHADSWRVLANTALVLARSPIPGVPPTYDPLGRRFSWIASTIGSDQLSDASEAIHLEDIAADLGLTHRLRRRLFDFYTAEGLELAFEQYGVLGHMRGLGYSEFRVEVARDPRGNSIRVYGTARGAEHVLLEAVLEVRTVQGERVVYVHWLTIRNPLARFDEKLPGLPGQEVRGLGIAREVYGLFGRMAARLRLAGVAFTPSHYHMAQAAQGRCRFVRPERQGRFEAMVRDLGDRPVAEVTRAVAEGRVRCNGEPYAWEAEDMVAWLEPRPGLEEEASSQEAERCRFSIVD
jgi:acetoin utilization deacetylase AcuC-like enzyme